MSKAGLLSRFSVMRRLSRLFSGGGNLRSRTRIASIWTMGHFVANNGLRLVSNLILTRLLSPEAFGLISLARIFLKAMKLLSDVGAKQSVIRSKRGEDEEFLRTAWTVQVLRGVLVMGLACLIAWPAAQAYDEDILFPLICMLSITSVFGGLTTISSATLNRKLMLRKLIILSLITQTVSMCITIAAAWALGTVWALAIGGVLGSLFNLVMGHIFLPPFKHRFRLEPEATREIIRYGRWILLGTLFTFMGNKGRIAIQGLMVPVEIVGLISIAALIAWMPGQLVSKMLGSIIFPAFSEIWRDRPQDLPRVLQRVRLTVIFGVFPAFFIISFFAQPIIDLMYDDRYAAAGPILAIMALNGALGMLGMPYQNLLLAEGKSDLHATSMFLYAGLSILGMLLGYWGFGFLGIFVGIACGTVLQFLFLVGIAYRRGYSTWSLDFLALAVIGAFYVYTVNAMELPAQLAVL